MRTIHKYPLELAPEVPVIMPDGAEIIAVQEQFGLPTIWAIVDTDKPKKRRIFRIIGTGQNNVPDKSFYLGTVQIDGFVWHVFE
jgi:hypothetical protein